MLTKAYFPLAKQGHAALLPKQIVSSGIVRSALFSTFSNTSSLYNSRSWTVKQQEAVGIFEDSVSKAMHTGTPVLLALDFDGTTGHTKQAIHESKVRTYSKVTGEVARFCENTAVHMVDGVPESMFRKHYGEKWKFALETFEEEMNVHYPVLAKEMPGVYGFLDAASILKDVGVLKMAIVSYMEHGRLNMAASNLDLWRYMDAVEGSQNKGHDKTTSEMFTERVYPKLFKEGEPSSVICMGDSRHTDRLTAESVPGEKGSFIAFGKGKCGAEPKEETEYPHIPNWFDGQQMFIVAAQQAVEKFKGTNVLMTTEQTRYVQNRLEELARESENRRSLG